MCAGLCPDALQGESYACEKCDAAACRVVAAAENESRGRLHDSEQFRFSPQVFQIRKEPRLPLTIEYFIGGKDRMGLQW